MTGPTISHAEEIAALFQRVAEEARQMQGTTPSGEGSQNTTAEERAAMYGSAVQNQPTISTSLAGCLQASGYACETCGGYGSVPNDTDKCMELCPECGGSRLNAEQRAIEADNAAIERCDQCGSALDLAPQEPVCHRCRAEAQADFSYAPEAP